MTSVTEYFVDIRGAQKVVRVEIFRSKADQSIFRGRAWIQNIYNLYPALVNTDANGKDLRSVHSADELNVEISSLVVADETYLSGKRCDNEDEILNYFVDAIGRYVASANEG